ncbi:hypothetical protein RC859_001362 [Vibrio alginolyticus]|nr:hypothetical protein [Vibrio alginolyticus]
MFLREESYSECDICGAEVEHLTLHGDYYYCNSCLSQQLYFPDEDEDEDE